MAKPTPGQASFLHDEPNVAVVAALRPDGTPHQTVTWIDYDGEHVLVNLNTWRTKLRYLEADPRVSVLVVDRNDPFRRIRIDGRVAEITKEGAYEHIVGRARVYLGRDGYELQPGEERVLVRIEPVRIEATNIE
jgi:PPOX class probable F420-dependent enzyme